LPWLLVDRCSTAAAAASKREDARALWEDGASWREGKEEAAAGESRVFWLRESRVVRDRLMCGRDALLPM